MLRSVGFLGTQCKAIERRGPVERADVFCSVGSTSPLPLYPVIIHKMGQEETLLTVDHLIYGIDKLLAFVADRAAVESHRPPTPLNGAVACKTVVEHEFGDRVRFQLVLSSRTPPTPAENGLEALKRHLLEGVTSGYRNRELETNDLEVRMHWYFVEPSPKELVSEPRDQSGTVGTLAAKTSLLWILNVSVFELCYPWIKPGRDRDLRRVRSILDKYARPRLILPRTDAAAFREDFIALLALFAGKAECLATRDERLPRFFRSYCDGLLRPVRVRRRLSEAEWYGAVDRVFERLYRGEPGMGFTMPAFAASFRAYVSRAIRGAAAGSRCKTRRVLKTTGFPESIDDAAARLGVSHMTVRRWMRRRHFREWTQEAWLEVYAKVTAKKGWQKVITRLQEKGLLAEAARKQVQRCKRHGLTLDKAIRRSSLAKAPRGTCTACGEEQAAGDLFGGKFHCGSCLAEKMEVGGA
jgi:hypothetical protein